MGAPRGPRPAMRPGPRQQGNLDNQVGHKGRGGRPKKTQEERDAKGICLKLVTDPEYLEGVRARLLKGTMAPGMEVLLWYMAYGKPKETVETRTAVAVKIIFEELPSRPRLTDGEVVGQALIEEGTVREG